MSYCVECGTKLKDGAKFCQKCGAKTALASATATKSKTSDKPKEDKSQRHQEYVGKVYKCPNCGEQVDHLAAVCPACHYRLNNKGTSSAVSAFKIELLELEKQRKNNFNPMKTILSVYGMAPADTVDRQKIALIESFPVPNDIGEMLDFMLLAASNIDNSLSKNSLRNRFSKMTPLQNNMTINLKISDAWVGKMVQIYERAEVLFPNDPVFVKIKDVYDKKMRELKR